MAQQVTFIWMAVVEEDAVIDPEGPNHLVRPAYRAAPVGTDIQVVRRESRTEIGTARFSAVWTAPSKELLARFRSELTEGQAAELEAFGNDLATLLRFEMV